LSVLTPAVTSLVLRARFVSKSRYRWDGEEKDYDPRIILVVKPRAPYPVIVAQLAQTMYEDAYTAQDAAAGRANGPTDKLLEDEFARELHGANRTQKSWTPGFTLVGPHERGLKVTSPGGVERIVKKGEFRPGTNGGPGWVRVEKGTAEMLPGWYQGRGTEDHQAVVGPTVRVYWNVCAAGAAPLMTVLSSRLNGAKIPFHLKALTDRQRYTRPDAAVLYVAKDDWRRAAPELVAAHSELGKYLKDGAPLFTFPVGSGVALAEDPGSGESFGTDRCSLVAEGLWDAFVDGRSSDAELEDAVMSRFRSRGIPPETPYLRHGSDARNLLLSLPKTTETASRAPVDFLAEASEIGDRLVAEAVRDGTRATWIARPVPVPGASRDAPVTAETLDATLYSGTAGIALFLARLARSTRNRRHRTMAIEAARHAVALALDGGSAGRFARESRYGFHGGILGPAWAALEVGRLTKTGVLRRGAAEIVSLLRRNARAPHDLDLINGTAGALPVLLEMEAQGIAGAGLLARSLKNELGRKAAWAGDVCSWRGPLDRPGAPNLTGFSHGAAGISWALAMYGVKVDDEGALRAARGGLAYERACFDTARGNWPRFDIEPGPDGRPATFTAWCHGAPGIGLSRALLLRTGFGGKDEERALVEELRVARRTTADHLARLERFPGLDVTACHGVLGTVECLWEIEDALGLDGKESAAQYGTWVATRFGSKPRRRFGTSVDYPTAVPARAHPSLMNGLAGIGHFFLRLHDQKRVQSILTPAQSL
jgi:hypothetical protein